MIAILPVTDERLAHDVLQPGANAWWPLDAPRDLLRSMVVVFAGGGTPADPESRDRPRLSNSSGAAFDSLDGARDGH